jgi:hypothetical protein
VPEWARFVRLYAERSIQPDALAHSRFNATTGARPARSPQRPTDAATTLMNSLFALPSVLAPKG